MTARRLLLAAAAGLVISGSAASAGPAAPATAATATHVAIVVGGVGTACVPAGGSGLALLTSAFDVTIGQSGPTAGMVLKINGVGSYSVDPDYWSYWQGSGSRWTYATSGPASTRPSAGSVEGWAFGSYASTDQPPLAAPDYQSICGRFDPPPAPAPASSRPTSRTAAAATSARPAATPAQAAVPTAPEPATVSSDSQRRPAPASGASASGATASAGSPPAPERPGEPRRSVAAGASGTAEANPGPAPDSAAVTTDVVTPTAQGKDEAGTSALPQVGTVLGLAVVALLGVAAYLRSRRNRTGET